MAAADAGKPEKWLALMPAFFNGMLDAAAPGVTFIDGNEHAYYYESPDAYYRSYHLMKQRAQALVAEENRPKYISQAQAGMALYVDEVLGRRKNKKTTGFYLIPEKRLRFFEHNTYYALTTTDEYVWLYSETMNWWTDSVPEGLEAAVISARQKYEQGKPLGYDITDMIKEAREKRAQEEKKKK